MSTRRRLIDRGLTLTVRSGLLTIALLVTLPFGSIEIRWQAIFTAAVSVLAIVFFARALTADPPASPSWPLFPAAAGIALLGFAQLVPLPVTFAEKVSPERAVLARITSPEIGPPGKSAGSPALESIGPAEEPADPPAPVSSTVNPGATRLALTSFAAIYLFFVMVCNEARQPSFRRLLLGSFIGLGAFQAVYGIAEHVSGRHRIFGHANPHAVSVSGTFINKNHFALLMAMILPVALVALAACRGRGTEWWKRLIEPAWQRTLALRVLLWIAVSLIVSALLLSESRSGIAVAVVAVIFIIFALHGHGSSRRLHLTRAILVGASLILPVAAVLDPQRVAGLFAGLLEEPARVGDRMTVWAATAGLAGQYPFLGTGLGTYASVFQVYRPETVTLSFQHAHNDYLEWVAETGIFGILILSGALLVIGRKILAVPVSIPGAGAAASILAVGAGASVFAALLHSITDFGLRLFGNALVFASLAACIWVPLRQRERTPPRNRLPEVAMLPLLVVLAASSFNHLRADSAIRSAGRAVVSLRDAPGPDSLEIAGRAWRRLEAVSPVPAALAAGLEAAEARLCLSLASAVMPDGPADTSSVGFLSARSASDPEEMLRAAARGFRAASIADPLEPSYYVSEVMARLTVERLHVASSLTSTPIWPSADRRLRIAERLGPNRASILEMAGQARLFAGDSEPGAELLGRAMALDPERRTRILRSLMDAGLPARLIVRTTAPDAASRLELAQQMERVGEDIWVERELAISARLAGQGGEPLLRYVEFLARRERLAELAALVDGSSSASSKDRARVLYVASDAFARKQDYARSREYAEQAAALQPGEIAYQEILARALFSLGKPAEAARVYGLALKRLPPLGEPPFVEKRVRVSLGEALEASGEPQAAIAQYSQVLRMDAADEAARRAMDRLMAR